MEITIIHLCFGLFNPIVRVFIIGFVKLLLVNFHIIIICHYTTQKTEPFTIIGGMGST